MIIFAFDQHFQNSKIKLKNDPLKSNNLKKLQITKFHKTDPRSKAKIIFGQFLVILLLDPLTSGRYLWVKKWITFLDLCDGAAGG